MMVRHQLKFIKCLDGRHGLGQAFIEIFFRFVADQFLHLRDICLGMYDIALGKCLVPHFGFFTNDIFQFSYQRVDGNSSPPLIFITSPT